MSLEETDGATKEDETTMSSGKGINVLSLFDGMSCGQLALRKAGIRVATYYASEIDKSAIAVTQHNFPSTVQLGDVTKIDASGLPQIDLVLGGSPCQGFSFAGKELNFSDPRSVLFFEFVRLIGECSPKYWLLENVVMRNEYIQMITDFLGVDPVRIDSALVSAQNRPRLYWSNFHISQPADVNARLPDILEEDGLPARIVSRRLNSKGKREDYNKNIPLTPCLEVRPTHDKSHCITTVDKDNVLSDLPPGRYPDAFSMKQHFRYYTTTEYCRLQTVPENYFDDTGVSETKARKMLGNGWTVDVIAHILRCAFD